MRTRPTLCYRCGFSRPLRMLRDVPRRFVCDECAPAIHAHRARLAREQRKADFACRQLSFSF